MADAAAHRVIVISAHAVDFVWRCGGTMARYARNGSPVRVIALTFGERGESGEVWKARPGITVDEVKKIRRHEGEDAARILGAEIRFLDFDDYPMMMNEERYLRLVAELRDFQPTLALTHHGQDQLNFDHAQTTKAYLLALRCAQMTGVDPGAKVLGPVQSCMFEPQQPEFSGFNPDVYIDITDVMDVKKQAMAAVVTQAYTAESFISRAEYRGQLAQRVSGDKRIKYAEAFTRFEPYVGKTFA